MNKVSKVVLSSLLAFSTLLPAQAAPMKAPPTLRLGTVSQNDETQLTPGVVQKSYKVSSKLGPQAIYSLEVNSAEKNIEVVPGLSNESILGVETVSNQVKRLTSAGKTVIGAVNADYFNVDAKKGGVGEPFDLMVRNGEILTTNSTATDQLAVFGIDAQGRPLIGSPDVMITVSDASGTSEIVNAINKQRSDDMLVLYTPVYATSTRTNKTGVEIVLTQISGKLNGNNKVQTVVKSINRTGNTTLKKGEYVLSGTGLSKPFLDKIKVGQALTFDLTYDDAKWANVKQTLGGRYRVVKNGKAVRFTGNKKFLEPVPRTAIGIKADGTLVVVALDGRNKKHSIGLPLNETAQLMADLGAVEAMTFDGGGSTTFMSRKVGDVTPTIQNKPSDGRERSVSNSLIFVSKWPKGQPEKLLPATNIATNLRWFVNSTNKLPAIPSLKALDYANNVVPVPPGSMTFTSTVGTVGNGQVIAPAEATKGQLTAAIGNAKLTFNVDVTDQLDSIDVAPKLLQLVQGQAIPLSIKGMFGGQAVVTDLNQFQVTVDQPTARYENGQIIAGQQDGSGTITVSYKTKSIKIPYSIGVLKSGVIDNFEALVSTWTATGVKYKTIDLGLDTKIVKNGAQSLRLTYDFTGTTGTSGAYATPLAPYEVRGLPNRIGMWIYGDGVPNWLRMQIRDGANNIVQLDIAKQLDWTGWKYVEVPVPQTLAVPLKIEMPLRIMQTNDALKASGTIYMDDLSIIYEAPAQRGKKK